MTEEQLIRIEEYWTDLKDSPISTCGERHAAILHIPQLLNEIERLRNENEQFKRDLVLQDELLNQTTQKPLTSEHHPHGALEKIGKVLGLN